MTHEKAIEFYSYAREQLVQADPNDDQDLAFCIRQLRRAREILRGFQKDSRRGDRVKASGQSAGDAAGRGGGVGVR